MAGQGCLHCIFSSFPVADLTAGIFLAQGILCAIIERERSGKGQWVQSSLLGAMVNMMDFQAARYLVDRDVDFYYLAEQLITCIGNKRALLPFLLATQLESFKTFLQGEVAPEARGSAVALHAFHFYVGQSLGPVAVGAASGLFGAGAAFALAGLGMLALGWRLGRR